MINLPIPQLYFTINIVNEKLPRLSRLLDETIHADESLFDFGLVKSHQNNPAITKANPMTLETSPQAVDSPPPEKDRQQPQSTDVAEADETVFAMWEDIFDFEFEPAFWPWWWPLPIVATVVLCLIVTIGLMMSWSSGTVLASENHSILFATITPTPDATYAELGQEQLQMSLLAATPTSEAYFADANEMGQILILEYHRIASPETRYQRSPENFRADLRRLHEEGYYPVNFIDLIHGLPDVPAGKKPIVLSFDDSDVSQFRVLDNHTVDADTAVGCLLDFHNAQGDAWPMRATFFVMGDERNNYYSVFGQSKWAKAKLQFLVEQGIEIGSHTVTHADLGTVTADRIQWELAVSKHVIEEMVPDYKVQSLSVPFGSFPYTLDFLKAGQWEEQTYQYIAVAAAWGGPTVSPFHEAFTPYKVPRLEVTGEAIDYWLTHFQDNPELYYVSDGDPTRLTYPQEIATISQ